MSDDVDRANDTAGFYLDLAMANRPAPSLAPSRQFCENCGVPIPAARREAVSGVTMCVDCQADDERREFYR